jgi:hypothetical protein
MDVDKAKELARKKNVETYLFSKGWMPLGNWRFISPTRQVHDMSAADLSQLDKILAEGLFKDVKSKEA